MTTARLQVQCERSVRGRKAGFERPNFRSHQALRTIAETHQQAVARLQVHDAVFAERFHVNENIFRSIAPGHEAKSANPVEPLHHRNLEAAGGHNLHMGAWLLQLGGMGGCRFIDREDAIDLQALRAGSDFANDASPLWRLLEAVTTQHRHVQENIRSTTVWHDEAVALGHVEPLDGTGHLVQFERPVLSANLRKVGA